MEIFYGMGLKIGFLGLAFIVAGSIGVFRSDAPTWVKWGFLMALGLFLVVGGAIVDYEIFGDTSRR